MQKHILVVDDDRDLRRMLSESLRSAGYRVAGVSSGTRALETLRRLRPNAIIMDLMLPGMDGFVLCEKLRRNPETADIPILVLTGISSQIARFAGMESGASDYLTKPFSVIDLLDRLQALVSPVPAAS